jgi:hypothetical protein
LQVAFPYRKNDLVDTKLTPREAREGGSSYSSGMTCSISIELYHLPVGAASRLSGGALLETTLSTETMNLSVKFGDLPIMVMSSKCHLVGKSAAKVIYIAAIAHTIFPIILLIFQLVENNLFIFYFEIV